MPAEGPPPMSDQDKALFGSIQVRSLDGVNQAIHEGANVNARGLGGRTPLHHASSQYPIVRRLLRRGADPNVADALGRTPLHDAVSNPESDGQQARHEVLTEMLNAKADANARDARGRTPLHDAAKNPSRPDGAVDQLLSRFRGGADPNVRDDLGNTPLHYAARNPTTGRGYAVETLISRRAKLNIQNHSGNTPLHMAVAGAGKDQARTISLLLNKDATLTLRNSAGQTPLELSASLKNPVAQIIIERHIEAEKLSARRAKNIERVRVRQAQSRQKETKPMAKQAPSPESTKTPSKTGASRMREYHEKVADLVIKQIKDGVAPWQKPWKPGEKVLPENLSSGNRYNGGNSLHLAAVAQERGYSDNRWGTLKQINRQGGRIRKGERGVSVLWVQHTRQVKATDEKGKPVLDSEGKPTYREERLNPPHVKTYTVFNAEQADRLPARSAPAAKPSWKAHQRAENVLKASGVPIHNRSGDAAYYNLGKDEIVLPNKSQFPSADHYYQTALHEVGHATGHPDRMNRESLQKGVEAGFGSQAYAKEEMRAEISAMMTGERIGVGHDPSRGAAYVESWVAVLKKDPLEIRHAAGDAQKMSDYVLRRGREKEAQRPAEPNRTRANAAAPKQSRQQPEPGRAAAQKVAAPAEAPARALKRTAGPSR